MSAPSGGGCEITDRLRFELRRPLDLIPGARSLARTIVAGLFAHRHRRLVQRWAGPPEGA